MKKISFGVMKTTDWNMESKHAFGAIYRIACSCGDPDCDACIIFEVDEDMLFTMDFYKKFRYNTYWKGSNIFKRFWERIKAAVKILFLGHIELEDSLIIEAEQIPDIINLFTEAQEKIKEYTEKHAS